MVRSREIALEEHRLARNIPRNTVLIPRPPNKTYDTGAKKPTASCGTLLPHASGRVTPRVSEGLWLGRGYGPAHLLDFLHCQAYGRAESREGLLAALSRARLCSTLLWGLLVLGVLGPPEPLQSRFAAGRHGRVGLLLWRGLPLVCW